MSSDNKPLLNRDTYNSSSHDAYLVGHQLAGVSAIEGYIRAHLHRSVERESYLNYLPSLHVNEDF